VTAHLRRWLAGRTERERRLVLTALAVVLLAALASAVAAVHEDLTTRRARVDGHARELAAVRRLAATVGADAAGGPDDGTLVGTVQAAADAAGLGERVAAMTPEAGGDERSTSLSVRVVGASLADTVRLLHELDAEPSRARIARLALRKHPDDPRRFDVTLDVAGRRTP
jgi:Type II secretion system (T2SS), protein M